MASFEFLSRGESLCLYQPLGNPNFNVDMRVSFVTNNYMCIHETGIYDNGTLLTLLSKHFSNIVNEDFMFNPRNSLGGSTDNNKPP